MSPRTRRRPRSNATILRSTVACVMPRWFVKPIAQLPPGRSPTSAPSQSHDNRSETRVKASNASPALASTATDLTTECAMDAFYRRTVSLYSPLMLPSIRVALADALRVAAREKLGAEPERFVFERPPRLEPGH